PLVPDGEPPRAAVSGIALGGPEDLGENPNLLGGRVAPADLEERLGRRGLVAVRPAGLRRVLCPAAHSGTFPCFLAVTSTTLRSSRRSACETWRRVCDGGMTAST